LNPSNPTLPPLPLHGPPGPLFRTAKNLIFLSHLLRALKCTSQNAKILASSWRHVRFIKKVIRRELEGASCLPASLRLQASINLAPRNVSPDPMPLFQTRLHSYPCLYRNTFENIVSEHFCVPQRPGSTLLTVVSSAPRLTTTMDVQSGKTRFYQHEGNGQRE